MQNNEVLCNATQRLTQRSAMQCNANATQSNATQLGVTQRNAMQCNTTQRNAMQRNVI
jgi:hypothetical protein